LCRARQPDLTRPCFGEKLGGDGNRDAVQPVIFEFALPRVDARPGLESQSTGSVAEVQCTAKSPDRAIERRQAPIARRLAPTKTAELRSQQHLVTLDQTPPTAVAQLGGSFRRVHDLCEQDCGEYPVTLVSASRTHEEFLYRRRNRLVIARK